LGENIGLKGISVPKEPAVVDAYSVILVNGIKGIVVLIDKYTAFD
jgi:hypothetical protein